jgi:putative FmdB family regulatory protein
VPIYAYKCSACDHAQDVLQKMSDPLLTSCPECGQETYVKQVTSAGFQLKGTGWYVTDFRNNGSNTKPDAGGPASADAGTPAAAPAASAAAAAAPAAAPKPPASTSSS